MPLITLPIGWTILLDSVAWAILQPAIAYLCTRPPASAFDPSAWLYRPRPWERGGATYERLFLVKRWKTWLPSGGPVFRDGFSMRRITSRDRPYLERWAQETCRAELTHWIALGISPLFFLWNPPLLGLCMVLYAIIVNAPCIIVQRHNRPQFMRLLRARQQGAEDAEQTQQRTLETPPHARDS